MYSWKKKEIGKVIETVTAKSYSENVFNTITRHIWHLLVTRIETQINLTYTHHHVLYHFMYYHSLLNWKYTIVSGQKQQHIRLFCCQGFLRNTKMLPQQVDEFFPNITRACRARLRTKQDTSQRRPWIWPYDIKMVHIDCMIYKKIACASMKSQI